jgi:hypothetical protein
VSQHAQQHATHLPIDRPAGARPVRRIISGLASVAVQSAKGYAGQKSQTVPPTSTFTGSADFEDRVRLFHGLQIPGAREVMAPAMRANGNR